MTISALDSELQLSGVADCLELAENAGCAWIHVHHDVLTFNYIIVSTCTTRDALSPSEAESRTGFLHRL